MRRTTIIGGVGGAVFFPAVVMFVAFKMPSLNPAFQMLIRPPLLLMQAILGRGNESWGVFVVIYVILYVMALGFGIGAYLGSLFGKS